MKSSKSVDSRPKGPMTRISGTASTGSAVLQAIQMRMLEEEECGWNAMELEFDDITEAENENGRVYLKSA